MIDSSPSMRGIAQLSAINHEGKTNLLVLSSEEEMLGIAEYSRESGFSFPYMIKVDGVPLAALPSVTGKQKDDKILVLCEQDSDFNLMTFVGSENGSGYEPNNQYEIEELRREPDSLFSCDLNGDDLQDVLILSNRDAPVILLADQKDGWQSVAQDSVVRKSFMKGLELEKLSKFNDPVSKKDRLLVCLLYTSPSPRD